MPAQFILTSFGPFGSFETNPSQQLMERVRDTMPLDLKTRFGFEVLPVSYDAVSTWVESKRPQPPRMSIHLGVAAGERMMRLETRARNECFGEDVEGQFRERQPIIPQLDSIETTCVRKCLHDVEAFFPDEVRSSDDAGAYLCNYLYFLSLVKLGKASGAPTLFLHVPDPTLEDALKLARQAEIVLHLIERLVESL